MDVQFCRIYLLFVYFSKCPDLCGAAVAEWLSSWLAEQEVRGSIPRLATWISEISYLPLPSRDMAEIPLTRRKSAVQPTNQPDLCICIYIIIYVFIYS